MLIEEYPNPPHLLACLGARLEWQAPLERVRATLRAPYRLTTKGIGIGYKMK